jgi:hypothetical protein
MLKTMFILSFLLCAPAAANTIYKCLDGGKVSYTDRPCGNGAVKLNVPAAPAVPEAAERMARQRALLQDIEARRAKEEEQEARAALQAQRAAGVQRKRCDKLRLQHKWLEEDLARAGRDEAERTRTKARRQAELLAMECPA